MRNSLRKSLLTAVAAAALCVAFVEASARQTPPLAGGYGEAPVGERRVLEAARFAVREENRRERRRVSLVAVRRAEQQVVAGMNYRLRLSVRVGGRARDVTAVVYRNLQGVYSLTSWEAAGDDAAAATREVKVYLVAVGDEGRRGRKIGCDDSLVPVRRAVNADGSPLRAALGELLAVPHEYEGGLGNYWFGENLRVSGAAISGGTATIRITGRLYVAGVCDEPRIEEQIRETARQFPGVRRVKVFVNGRTLASAIR